MPTVVKSKYKNDNGSEKIYCDLNGLIWLRTTTLGIKNDQQRYLYQLVAPFPLSTHGLNKFC